MWSVNTRPNAGSASTPARVSASTGVPLGCTWNCTCPPRPLVGSTVLGNVAVVDALPQPVVVLVDLPDEHVRSVRRRLALPELDAFARAHLDGAGGTPYLVFHAPVTPDGAGRRRGLLPVPAGRGAFRAGGRFAAATVRGDDARPPRPAGRARGGRRAGPRRRADAGRAAARALARRTAVQVAWPVEEAPPGG